MNKKKKIYKRISATVEKRNENFLSFPTRTIIHVRGDFKPCCFYLSCQTLQVIVSDVFPDCEKMILLSADVLSQDNAAVAIVSAVNLNLGGDVLDLIKWYCRR